MVFPKTYYAIQGLQSLRKNDLVMPNISTIECAMR